MWLAFGSLALTFYPSYFGSVCFVNFCITFQILHCWVLSPSLEHDEKLEFWWQLFLSSILGRNGHAFSEREYEGAGSHAFKQTAGAVSNLAVPALTALTLSAESHCLSSICEEQTAAWATGAAFCQPGLSGRFPLRSVQQLLNKERSGGRQSFLSHLNLLQADFTDLVCQQSLIW